MVRKSIQVSRLADGTYKIRTGRYVEFISGSDKTKGEVFDAVKWALVAAGFPLSDIEITELLQQISEEGR